MGRLTDADLLTAWERGCAEPRPARLLALLAAVSSSSAHELASLPLGERDRRLLALRQRLFGAQFVGVAACARCAEPVEVVFDSGDLPAVEAACAERVPVRGGQARMPTTFDLVAAHNARDAGAARAMLVERCIGSACEPQDVDAAASALAEADPFLDLTVGTACTRCGTALTLSFDVEAFLWSELEAWARRALRTIATLARAFGWSESEILAMSPWRREAYLRIAVA
ncbi:MAG: hypothetical protein JWM87_252 [Candidatus Eremiobacteraeota bacterium]|nr:hypothetical protein [Candidatus Eremiobacteraeota bacterium]